MSAQVTGPDRPYTVKVTLGWEGFAVELYDDPPRITFIPDTRNSYPEQVDLSPEMFRIVANFAKQAFGE